MNIIYIRTSTTEQNPQNQLEECKKINTFGEASIYEEHQSAWKDSHRDKFEEVRKLIISKKVEHLIVWDLDRLYRDRKKMVGFFQICKGYGCKVHSVRQKFLENINQIPSPFNEIMGDIFIQILGWLAEEESNKKSERVKLAVRKHNGVTRSYKGKKWGRKQLSTIKKNLMWERYNQEPKPAFRTLSKELNLSVGVVHKYITERLKQNDTLKRCS